ncbi:MAG: hypothetical protein AAF497_26895 [Planctomycetota bacterium]
MRRRSDPVGMFIMFAVVIAMATCVTVNTTNGLSGKNPNGPKPFDPRKWLMGQGQGHTNSTASRTRGSRTKERLEFMEWALGGSKKTTKKRGARHEVGPFDSVWNK